MISGEPIRNHPSSMISTVSSMVVPFAVIAFVMFMNYRDESGALLEIIYPITVLIAAGIFATYRIWKKTTYTFGANELIVNRDTVMKRVTNIQYSKLSSVNIQRGIVNKIFGTTTLLFNINSSVNTMRAEATLTLKSHEADALREELSKLIFSKEITVEEDNAIESIVDVSNWEIVLHGLIGQPTVAALTGVASFLFSILSLVFNNGGSFIASIIMLVASVLPTWIRNILAYSNYRIYRVGDTITIQRGLIRNYRTSFKINKVNSVRIREPALARLMGKAILEAEVVGLSDGSMPLLCPLKRTDIVMDAMQTLVPEHVFDAESHGQPGKAVGPMLISRILMSVPFVIIGVLIYIFVYGSMSPDSPALSRIIVVSMSAIAGILTPILILIHGLLAQRQRTFDMADSAFVIVTGGYDRTTEYMLYDKVQTVEVRSGPIQRMFGVSSCIVSILSSMGFKTVRSGLFLPEELEKVSGEIMGRISDGRYDYRRYL